MRNAESQQHSVTAKDIGRELGLSQPTVSRVLSGATGYRVAPETRRRVLEAAARLGYRPNAVARSLRRKRTNIVGFYTGYGYLDARNAFLAEVIGGLQRAADPHRFDVLLHGVYRGASTDAVYGELVDGRVDGLFVHTHGEDPLVALLRESSLPVVALADDVPGIPSVIADDAGGTRLLLDYLWERGHRRIAYVRPATRFRSVEARVETFCEEMAARGGGAEEAAPVLTIQVETAGPALDALRALPAAERPTAVCCWNDLTAFNLIHACRERGVRVPEDLAVVGFDGLLAPHLTPRALVTIGANWNDVTARAMEILVDQINHTGGHAPPVTRLPCRLLPGDTA
ncbi:MAG TPA: LacI family DNA-binding transcriptional regulator [Armatimonadaceae bacterium]|nr:LacI family DNA-binding transcriptional regulator [Armatimonadaceae bacterium]